MDELEIRKLIDDLQTGACIAGRGRHQAEETPFAELGFAKVDHHRALRQGLPEAVYGPGKTPEQCAAIVSELLSLRLRAGPVLLTRADACAGGRLARGLPGRTSHTDRASGGAPQHGRVARTGRAAGTGAGLHRGNRRPAGRRGVLGGAARLRVPPVASRRLRSGRRSPPVRVDRRDHRGGRHRRRRRHGGGAGKPRRRAQRRHRSSPCRQVSATVPPWRG